MKIAAFIFTFFLILSLHAQKKREELNEFFWGKNDIYKNSNTVPEKYKNESAVILYKLEDYDYHKFGTFIKYTQAFRLRVKLQDQAAIKDFSEYEYYDKNYGYNLMETSVLGIKIIKPDKTEIIVDVFKESVKIDKGKKIAIPSLAIGDVLDIYKYNVTSFGSEIDYGFEPEEHTLGSNYPILNYKLTFQTENDFFVNFNTYNGAPKLKEIESGKSNERKYELVATDIAKNDFPKWFFPLVEMPCYKFQVYFARNGKFEKWADAFLPENEKIVKSVVSKEDIYDFYTKKFVPSNSLYDDVKDFLKENHFSNEEEKIKAIYYFTRHVYFTRYIEAEIMGNENIISYPFQYYKNDAIFFSNEISFINFFTSILKIMNINYDIIIGTNKVNGPIKDILIQNNVSVLLKVYTEKPLYFGYFDPFSSPDLIDSSLENTEAYAIKVNNNKKVNDIEMITLPKTSYLDNVSKSVSTIKISPEFDKITTHRTNCLIGHNKEFEQEKIGFIDLIDEDYKRYNTTRFMELVKGKNKETYQKKYDALINKIKDKRKEDYKKELEDDIKVKIENESYKLLNSGRFGKNDTLKYQENFTIVGSLLKKAGPNYTFDIGKFIGSQVEINESEYKRENNIYLNFPRTFKTKIIFEIPEGYTVSGLEKLNVNVKNETGLFVATAVIEQNQLVINTNKEYYNYFEPNTNWQKMIDFLNAAYQFTQEKILLKKK